MSLKIDEGVSTSENLRYKAYIALVRLLTMDVEDSGYSRDHHKLLVASRSEERTRDRVFSVCQMREIIAKMSGLYELLSLPLEHAL
jgi:hypothetical protein